LIQHNIRWFVVFSVAVHAAVLTAWQQHKPYASHSGRVLQLEVTDNTAGLATASPASTNRQTRMAAAERPLKPARQAKAAARQQQQAQTPTQTMMPADSNSLTSAIGEALQAPAQTASATHSPTPGRQEVERQLRTSVLELIAKQLKYPAIARRKGWQGIVQLELHIEPDGRISRLRIDRTSGYPVLDNAAAKALQFASLPQARQWLGGQAVDLIIPVEYRLLEG
jgi:protein TonB